MERLEIRRPDDWHLHLRDGAAMADAVAQSAASFARALVMPNLRPPVVSTSAALAYRERILAAVPEGGCFEPLMSLYLTEATPLEEVTLAAASRVVVAFKLYPAGATTNSESGVTSLDRVTPVLEALEREQLPLLVHGEVVDPEVDVFDREAVFVERVLAPLVERHRGLRVVLEHVSSATGVAFVEAAPPRVAATITPHHLLLDRNALLAGGLRPHRYCAPVVKRRSDRLALVRAATGGGRRFFLGTDSAPHSRAAKECPQAAAGVFSAPTALAVCAAVFEKAGAHDRLEAFVAGNGADFYGLPRNGERIVLERHPWRAPESYPFGDDEVVPLAAGEELAWRVVG